MAALAVEALLNAVGSRVAPDWTSYEKLKPHEKVDELLRLLSIAADPDQSPWPIIRFIHGFRNDIAHPKPENVEESITLPEHAADKFLFRTPMSILEREITPGKAKRALSGVLELKGILTDALAPELRFGIYADAWSHSVSAA